MRLQRSISPFYGFLVHTNLGLNNQSPNLGWVRKSKPRVQLWGWENEDSWYVKMVSNFSEKQGLEEIANLINPLRQTVSYLQWLLFHACLLSHFSHIQLFETLWNVAHQALLSVGFSRQEYWSGLPCPAPGYIPDPGVEPASLMFPALQADSLPSEPPGKPLLFHRCL